MSQREGVEFAGEIFGEGVDEDLIIGRGFREECHGGAEFDGVDFAENVFSRTPLDSVYQLSAFD